MIAILAVAGVTLGTIGLGAWGVRFARTTSDLLVASRAVTPWWNAAAISGEYLSAASFLGIAGLELKLGASALWQSLGFTAGYVALLLFVAAPLRRFGSYTIPDFVEARLRSGRLRSLASVIVLVIVVFYLVPQLKGAGIALNVVTGAPYWVGVAVVGAVVATNVGLGGMRGITYVQAFQFWVKVFAIAVPACVLLIHVRGLPDQSTLFGHGYPHAGAGGLRVGISEPTRVSFPTNAHFTIDGRSHTVRAGASVTLPRGHLRVPAGTAVPAGPGIENLRGSTWSRPVSSRGESSTLFVYSLLIATFLGTMGLPHILVRFYTNPDGRAARKTTVRVLGLLGLFYAFPAVYGALGRAFTPALYTTAETDTVVLRVPQAAWPGTVGELLGAVVAAGAFAAFLSTSSGLLVSIAGTISHDVWPRLAGNSPTTMDTRRRRFRIAASIGMVAPVVLAFWAQGISIAVLVGWAFVIAASTFCPVFLLGIWWPRLTARAAASGMIAGALVATAGIFADLALDEPHTPAGALLAQPAIVSVPIAFAVMIVGSLLSAKRPDVEAEMLALHAPEGLGLAERVSEADLRREQQLPAGSEP